MKQSTHFTSYDRVLNSALLIAATFTFLILAPVASAQDTPREVRSKAQAALTKGAYSEAVVCLQQLIEWYGTSKSDATIMQMESVNYGF